VVTLRSVAGFSSRFLGLQGLPLPITKNHGPGLALSC